MPTRPPSVCGIPNCHDYAHGKRYCPAHSKKIEKLTNKEYNRFSRDKSRQKAYNTNHRRIRRMVFAQQPICNVKGCTKPSEDLDHINNDPWDLRRENLQGLCKSHHTKKTSGVELSTKQVPKTWNDGKSQPLQ